MIIIIIEIFLSIVSLYFIGKKVFHYFHFTKKSFLLTFIYSVLYFLVIYLVKNTYFGQEIFRKFIQQSIVHGSIWTLTIYPIIIAFSEELFFRLYFRSEKINMLLAALIFTILHWRPGYFSTLMFLILFIFALIQWSLLKKTKSLWSVVITHLVAFYSLLLIYG